MTTGTRDNWNMAVNVEDAATKDNERSPGVTTVGTVAHRVGIQGHILYGPTVHVYWHKPAGENPYVVIEIDESGQPPVRSAAVKVIGMASNNEAALSNHCCNPNEPCPNGVEDGTECEVCGSSETSVYSGHWSCSLHKRDR